MESSFLKVLILPLLAGLYIFAGEAPIWALCGDLVGKKQFGTAAGIMSVGGLHVRWSAGDIDWRNIDSLSRKLEAAIHLGSDSSIDQGKSALGS